MYEHFSASEIKDSNRGNSRKPRLMYGTEVYLHLSQGNNVVKERAIHLDAFPVEKPTGLNSTSGYVVSARTLPGVTVLCISLAGNSTKHFAGPVESREHSLGDKRSTGT